MFDIMTGIPQQELTHDKGQTPRCISVMSHVSFSLSFPSQRQRYLSLVKHEINLSGVGENITPSPFLRKPQIMMFCLYISV